MSAKNKKLVLLDAHAIIHRAYHALPDFKSQKGEPTGALYGLVAMLIKLIKDLKPDYLVAAYDRPEKTFRHHAYEGYKAKRPKTEENLIRQLQSSRDIFEALNIPIYDKSSFEADDILGTIVEQLEKNPPADGIDIVIASGDLDTLQLVSGKKVKVYTLKRGLSDTILYDEEAVFDRFGFSPKLLVDYKGLRGDPSDNIPGIVGIGDKTATNLIQEFGTIEEMYTVLKKDPEKFEKAGFKPRIIKLLEEGEEEALFSKTLGQIRRDAPIDFSLPAEEWKEAVDVKKVEQVFKELNFKTLLERFRSLVAPSQVGMEKIPRESTPRPAEAFSAGGSDPRRPTEASAQAGGSALPQAAEVERISIALWLINSDIVNPTLEDIISYTEIGSFQEAKREILKEIKDKKLEHVYEEIELPIISIVKKMKQRGVLIDTTYLKKLSREYHKQLSILENKIWELAGVQFNINSPKQMAEVLFDKLLLHTKGLRKSPTGARSTRFSELEKLRGTHPIIDEIIAYRELQKLLSTYIDVIPKMVAQDSRLHADFIQSGTTTGRFSSMNPNLQNIPIRGERGKKIRNAFIAAPGHKLAAFDYSQIELRMAALFSQDKHLLKIFREGMADVHQEVAERVFGVTHKKVTAEMRRVAKVINFGILYGMGVRALARTLGGSREEAQEFYDSYFIQFPGILKYINDIKNLVQQKGYTETLFGRRRYIPLLRSSRSYEKGEALRMAINAPLQGTAADIIKLAIHDTESALDKAGLLGDVHLVLQIHDELIYEIRHDELDKAVPIIKKAMENVIPDKYFKGREEVPLKVNVSVGENWGAMQSVD